MYRYLC